MFLSILLPQNVQSGLIREAQKYLRCLCFSDWKMFFEIPKSTRRNPLYNLWKHRFELFFLCVFRWTNESKELIGHLHKALYEFGTQAAHHATAEELLPLAEVPLRGWKLDRRNTLRGNTLLPESGMKPAGLPSFSSKTYHSTFHCQVFANKDVSEHNTMSHRTRTHTHTHTQVLSCFQTQSFKQSQRSQSLMGCH